MVDERGLSFFDLMHYRHHDPAAVICVFDLIEFDGEDFRRTPIEAYAGRNPPRSGRRCRFQSAFRPRRRDHVPTRCVLGCERIVSKRVGSPYRAGRSDHGSRSKSRQPRP